ncbi:MAG: hypothetical protein A2428_00140 [Bdellovibrionales bacterium RIFOXYC1_FULL_54_43]|nr:MAG: hypothetical protein A2428_00140 [Bdellovibrionales bacterium RIFOXYC1_FULL_54_43]OFZ82252.1 MAG: hypothetical protein A2603_01015 [Bdellovibrionales bacterium RIFOXYD1_FULL_55_31]
MDKSWYIKAFCFLDLRNNPGDSWPIMGHQRFGTIRISCLAALFVTAPLSVVYAAPNPDQILQFDYEVVCDPDPMAFPGLTGSIELPDRQIRFELLKYINKMQVLLPAQSSEFLIANNAIRLDPNPACQLISLSHALLPAGDSTHSDSSPNAAFYRQLAIRHSPFLVVRTDQYRNRLTDLPLALAYSALRGRGENVRIRYTIYFTNEDKLPPLGGGLNALLTRYGRHVDVEWIYEVEVDPFSNVVARKFHGDWWLGIGHSKSDFEGSFLPGTDHPVLYNESRHNVFDDHPHSSRQKKKRVGYHLVPTYEIPHPNAREQILFDQPWMLEASDAECRREGKLPRPIEDHLFILISGELRDAAVLTEVTTLDGTVRTSGFGKGRFDRLGEDLWMHESYTSIPFDGTSLLGLGDLLHGQVRFPLLSLDKTAFRIDSLRFFRLVRENGRLRNEEITDRFTCRTGDVLHVYCSF